MVRTSRRVRTVGTGASSPPSGKRTKGKPKNAAGSPFAKVNSPEGKSKWNTSLANDGAECSPIKKLRVLQRQPHRLARGRSVHLFLGSRRSVVRVTKNHLVTLRMRYFVFVSVGGLRRSGNFLLMSLRDMANTMLRSTGRHCLLM